MLVIKENHGPESGTTTFKPQLMSHSLMPKSRGSFHKVAHSEVIFVARANAIHNKINSIIWKYIHNLLLWSTAHFMPVYDL